METNKISTTTTGQEINLIELARYFGANWKLYIKWGVLAAVTGIIIAFSLPKEYTTTVKLAPEATEGAGNVGNLGGLAAIAGIDLGRASGQDALSPSLYPDIVQSTPFLLELFSNQVNTGPGATSSILYDYMLEHQRQAWWNYILKAPFKLIASLTVLFSGQEADNDTINPFHLSKKQENVLKSLRERIDVYVDKKTQIVTVSVRMQNPFISAEITRDIVSRLQSYITNYRTQKAKQDLEFTDKVLREAKDSYYKAQKAYAAFEDANKNIISASYRTEQERLRNEMTLTFNVYNSLAQKQEQDKLRVQEQTPVYTVIEPATVPLKASSPRKLLILIGMIFTSILGVTGYLLMRKYAFVV